MNLSSYLRICGYALVIQLGLRVYGASLFPPILEDEVIGQEFYFDTDQHHGFRNVALRGENHGDPGTDIQYYNVGLVLKSIGSARLLKPNAVRTDFNLDQTVGESAIEFEGAGGSPWLTLGGYDQRFVPFGEWMFFDVFAGAAPGFYAKKLSILLGFRFTQEDGVHYGWVSLWRPDNKFTTPFTVQQFDFSPIPGDSIVAGRPPLIPIQARYTMTELRLSWATNLNGWVLEYSDDLEAKGSVWLPVHDVSGFESILPIPKQNRFYRLRK